MEKKFCVTRGVLRGNFLSRNDWDEVQAGRGVHAASPHQGTARLRRNQNGARTFLSAFGRSVPSRADKNVRAPERLSQCATIPRDSTAEGSHSNRTHHLVRTL